MEVDGRDADRYQIGDLSADKQQGFSRGYWKQRGLVSGAPGGSAVMKHRICGLAGSSSFGAAVSLEASCKTGLPRRSLNLADPASNAS